MPEVGLEPTWTCAHTSLSRARLPFRHSGTVYLYQKIGYFSRSDLLFEEFTIYNITSRNHRSLSREASQDEH